MAKRSVTGSGAKLRFNFRGKKIEAGTLDAVQKVIDRVAASVVDAAKAQAPVAREHSDKFYLRGNVYDRDMTLRESIFYAPFKNGVGGGLHAHRVMNVQRKKKDRRLLRRNVTKNTRRLKSELAGIVDNLKDT